MKRITALLLAVLMLALCVPASAAAVTDVDPTGTDISGVNAPYLTSGGGSSTTDFLTMADIAASRLTIINVWSNGCGPCVNEMPYFQQIHENYCNIGILVVGVCSTWINGSFASEWTYFQNHNYTYMNVVQDTVLYNLYSQNSYLPQTFIVSNQGVVVDFIGGGTTYENLVSKIDRWAAPFTGNYHDVTFVDGLTGQTIEVQSVPEGGRPAYPAAPSHDGYYFDNWDVPNPPYVYAPMTITANYEPGKLVWSPTDTIVPGEEYLIGFVSGGNTYLAVNYNANSSDHYFYSYNDNYLGYTALAVFEDGNVTGVNSSNAADVRHCTWSFSTSSGGVITSGYQSSYHLVIYTGGTSYSDLYPGLDSCTWTYNAASQTLTAKAGSTPRYAGYYALSGKTYMRVTSSSPTNSKVQLFRRTVLSVSTPLLGDVDCNGTVDMSDVSLLFSYLNGGSVSITAEGLENADANTDGSVNVMDITAIFNIIANS